MVKIIMGIDVSSTTIGLALIKINGSHFQLMHHEYFKPSKKEGLFESLLMTRNWIMKKVDECKPDDVVIEDIAQHFVDKSTAGTIIKLAVYNRTVGLAIYETLNKEPVLINVHTVRSIVKPPKYSGRLAKTDVPEAVAAILKIDFPYIFKKSGKIADENYDMADAMAVALAFGALEQIKKKQ